jgi:glycosyltransferase involved in cell wall biosynthesis
MNIWLIQPGERLPLTPDVRKMRTAFLADTLIERRHKIVWWASAFDHFQKKWICADETEFHVSDSLTIRCLKGCGYSTNICFRRIVDHRLVSWAFSPWARRTQPPDVIVASTPPYDLAYQAARYARRLSIPLLVDIRDPWPDLFLNHVPHAFHPLARVAMAREFSMMRQLCRSAVGIIGATGTFLDMGLRYAARQRNASDRVLYLGYRPRREGPRSDKIRAVAERCHGAFVVLFLGTLAAYHNPAVMLDAARRLWDRHILFVIAGDGELYDQLAAQAAALPNVVMTGWLGQADIDSILPLAHVGVCPTPFDIDLFPNKAFVYFSAGLPVLSAFQGDLQQVLTSEHVGFHFRPNDGETLANSISLLDNDRALLARMSANALLLFRHRFDVSSVYREYADLVESVCRPAIAEPVPLVLS